jgi:DNA processing protein
MRKLNRSEIPPQFFEIPDPPKELWIEGELPHQNDTVYLTVVGSRKYTNYGRDACLELIKGLAGYPITIVSGLAIGIDTIAHTTAIEAGLRTIAFPGSGLDNNVLYPRSNWQLANQIVLSGGALVSEFPPETPSAIWTFPRRNRLMAGLSDAVLIIEAEEKSGTLITARLALDYNKDVYVVPGSIFSSNSQGTNRLIRDGAHPICSSLDLLQALGFDPGNDKNTQENIHKEKNLTGQEKTILAFLFAGPVLKETLLKLSGFPIQEFNILMSQMELSDLLLDEGGVISKK